MLDIQHLALPVAEEMERSRQQYDQLLHHPNPLLDKVLRHFSEHKGKMMRPMLTLLCAKIFGEIDSKTISTALSFEFFHNASLVHDDIVDDSNERRGTPSLNAVFGNKIAVLAGDYLLALGLRLSSSTNDHLLTDMLAQAAQEIVSGEFLQLGNIENHHISEEVYYKIIRAKTAALFATCAKAGAEAVNAAPQDVKNMERLGEIIGICFQIKDDIFDYIAGNEIGKPTGNDMLEGKLTLPVIHALLTSQNQEMLSLAIRVKEGNVTAQEIASLVDFTIQNHGIEYAIQTMEKFAEEARTLLLQYPDTPVRSSLLQYVDYVIERNF